VRVVEAFGSEQERAECGAVHASRVVGVDGWTADVLRRVGGDATVDVGEAKESAHRRQPPIDRRRRELAIF
jgi:hypothetical protein